MNKTWFGVFLAFLLFVSSSTAYAAENQIKIDGVAIATDVKPELKDNRIMVPLRVVSENLGAIVEWSSSEVILTKSDMKVILTLDSSTAENNGESVLLDVKPYMKNNRVFVPLRFIAETFECKVNYSKFAVTVDTKPFSIDGVQVKAMQHEYHMTMGGVVQQLNGNAYNESMYTIFVKNKGERIEAPANYSWNSHTETGTYYKYGQYDFLDHKGNQLSSFDIYTLTNLSATKPISESPEVLIHDAIADEWYLFSETAKESINQLFSNAAKNGFLTIISNTVV
ncbi:copper amine oxidase N-terminal domain-containing protein [Paenibacillus sinopodophylli]|uniref:copper amine oxidase N-terminal domain-containing protein n=1 Tax=Paenibacillus sinopodophylli TaxID=1837342 RepID=UPI00110C9FEB|nr:copper amine oxidase N-terminal domain-containing protein [Paenibacillus sinopodophylli]